MQCSVLIETELEQRGIGAILPVSKGSNEPANIGLRRRAYLDIAGTSTKHGVGASGRPAALSVRYLSRLPWLQ